MKFLRQVLAVAVVVVLASPVSAGTPVVGVAGAANLATVGRVAMQPGSTIFSGDTIAVAENGRAQVFLQEAGMLGVEPNSSVRVHKIDTGYELELFRGKLRYRMPVGKGELRIANLKISNPGTKEVSLVVALRSPTTAVIASLSGELRIATDNSSKVVTLTEGKGIDVTAAPTPTPQGPAGANGGLTRGQSFLVGAIIVGGITAIGLAIGHIETKPPLPITVSPFIP